MPDIENKLSKKAYNYLTLGMCINLQYLKNEMLKINHKNLGILYKFIEFLIDLEIVNSNSYFDIEDFINKEVDNFMKQNNLIESNKDYYIFDSIRHAFIGFKEGGILQMYQYTQNEEWYPKITISQYIGIDKDINKLDNELIIYRGTSKDEFISKKFGQSWTLNYNIAYDFAFIHYKHQAKYKNSSRIILKTIVSKDIVFYYKENQIEDEVIINNNLIKIENIEIILEKNIL